MTLESGSHPKTRVSAVSYLNTLPLVWGLVHGPQAHEFDLTFELPAACAESVRSGHVQIGLVPVIEALRQRLTVISDVCISSDGPVRSIFLVHTKPIRQIQTIALDSSSRTSVALVRILLAERYGVRVKEHAAAPQIEEMLRLADAAILIGDPALQLGLDDDRFQLLDLGSEWRALTQLPMVYAVWAGKTENVPANAESVFRNSYEWGKSHLDEILARESRCHGVTEELARDYLSAHIRYEFDISARRGMQEFERLAQAHGLLPKN